MASRKILNPEPAETTPTETQSDNKPRTGAELVAALQADGVLGMWRDRPDCEDSSALARQLRDRAQQRN